MRKVDTNGIITTVAGNGNSLYSGDNGVATIAGVSPFSVAVDAMENLFIGDRNDHRVRKVTLNGSPILQLINPTTNSSGNYDVIITSSSGSVTSSVVTLAVGFTPVITTSPQNVLVTNGTAASFNVSVSGTPPFAFQWLKNGTNLTDGGNISGSGTNNLMLATTTTNDSWNYDVVVTNTFGSVTSTISMLIVVTPPSIITPPTNVIVFSGSNAAFTVTASGTGPLIYRWQLNGTNLPVNGIITTLAGYGFGGDGGDGGPAIWAGLSSPSSVAVDTAGEIFIADTGGNRVRKIDTNGIITTFAGNGTNAYSGDGGAATNASLHPWV